MHRELRRYISGWIDCLEPPAVPPTLQAFIIVTETDHLCSDILIAASAKNNAGQCQI